MQREQILNDLKAELEQEDKKDEKTSEPAGEHKFNTTKIFSREELLAILQEKAENFQKQNPDLHEEHKRLMVGTVGYPNVGKSSVINVLCGRKRVGVASLPGKTKHFQTLILNEQLCLCDCPGLVFPSFANSKAEMMLSGVLPIDTIRECVAPINLILSRVTKQVLEAQYKLKLPPRDSKQYCCSTFLQVFAAKRGWVTGSALPNEAMAARVVLKDYTTGRLLFCQVRPDYDPAKHGAIQQCGINVDLT